jgi:histidine triad (HIT) family protein
MEGGEIMDCIFCKIVAGEIPCDKVFEDDKILAFRDLNPEAPEHVLIIPKKHIESLAHATPDDHKLLGHIQLKIAEIAENLDLPTKGYRLVSNVGKDGGQSVFHLHYHLLGGRPMKWPPG